MSRATKPSPNEPRTERDDVELVWHQVEDSDRMRRIVAILKDIVDSCPGPREAGEP